MHFKVSYLAASVCVYVCPFFYLSAWPVYLSMPLACLSLCTMVHLAPHSKEQSGRRYKSRLNSSVEGIECPPSDRAFQKATGRPL